MSALGRQERSYPHGGSTLLSRQRALACGGAMLLVQVGIAHEVVGATLYPDGPASVGGPMPWHALGIVGAAGGLLILGGTLDLFAMPLVPLGVLASAIGAFFVAWDALTHHGFHFFAFTVVVAGVLVAVGGREANTRADVYG